MVGLVDVIWYSTCLYVFRQEGLEQQPRNTGKKSSFPHSCHFDGGAVFACVAVLPSDFLAGFYHAWHSLAGSCLYFYFIMSLGNSTVPCQNIPLQGKRGERRGLHIHMSRFTLPMIFSLAAVSSICCP